LEWNWGRASAVEFGGIAPNAFWFVKGAGLYQRLEVEQDENATRRSVQFVGRSSIRRFLQHTLPEGPVLNLIELGALYCVNNETSRSSNRERARLP
jgi:hypothetical protein